MEKSDLIFDINGFLKKAVEEGVSDIHLRIDEVPVVRKDGKIVKTNYPVIKEKDISHVLNVVLPKYLRTKVQAAFDLDFSYEIKGISREAGSRTKIAVFSNNKDVDPVGSCVGPKGMRVSNILNEIRGEKIDIIVYSEDPKEYVTAALSPAKVLEVNVLEEEKSCQVTVPESQLSLAIGKEGQNVRLAAKLTGWKIDIRPETGYYGE